MNLGTIRRYLSRLTPPQLQRVVAALWAAVGLMGTVLFFELLAPTKALELELPRELAVWRYLGLFSAIVSSTIIFKLSTWWLKKQHKESIAFYIKKGAMSQMATKTAGAGYLALALAVMFAAVLGQNIFEENYLEARRSPDSGCYVHLNKEAERTKYLSLINQAQQDSLQVERSGRLVGYFLHLSLVFGAFFFLFGWRVIRPRLMVVVAAGMPAYLLVALNARAVDGYHRQREQNRATYEQVGKLCGFVGPWVYRLKY